MPQRGLGQLPQGACFGRQGHHGIAADYPGQPDDCQADWRRPPGLGHLRYGASLLVVTLITVLFVKETPLVEKPNASFWPPMLRVLGMLGGLLAGDLAGLLGGLAGEITLLLADQSTAISVGIVGAGIGGLVADAINHYYMRLGYFAIFAAYMILFVLSTVSLKWVSKEN